MNRDIDAAAIAVERMSDALYVLDEEWRFRYLNPQAAALMRRPAAELLGTVVWESFPEAVGSEFERRFRHAVAGGEPEQFEAFFPPLGGWYQVRIFPAGGLLSVFFQDVTARHEAEAALRESEGRLRQVMDSLPVGVWVADVEGNIQSANPAGVRVWSGARAVGPGEYGVYRGWWSDTGAPIAAEEWAMARAVRTGAQVLGEIIDIEAFDGTRKTIRNSAVPIRDQHGAITGFVAINEDITEQRRAERALETSRRYLQRLFDAGPVGIAIGGGDGQVRAINDELLRILGRDRADMIAGGLRWTGLTVPEHRERDRRAIAEAQAHGRSLPFEKQFLRPDGSRVWVMMALLSPDETGEEGMAIAVDIQERKLAELEREALLAREQAARAETERERQRLVRLQRLTAALAGSVTVDDVAGAIVEEGRAGVGARAGIIALRAPDNPDELEIVHAGGYPPEVVATFRRIALTEEMPITAAVRLAQVVTVGSPAELIERYPVLAESQRHTGHQRMVAVPLLVRGTAIGAVGLSFTSPDPFSPEEQAYVQAVAGLCGAALDRARLYDEAQRARATAEAASRAKDEFLSIISHELRTPLTPIAAYAELLRDGRLPNGRVAEAQEAILRNARVEARLVEDLLDASRIVTGKLVLEREPLDLGVTVTNAVTTLKPAAAAAGLEVCLSVIPALLVDGDAARLQQAVTNLLTNAIKFTPSGGQIAVTLHQEGSEAVLAVRDTGAGIEPEFLPHVFERFRQGDSSRTRRHGGLGLGLAIVRYLVEQHGGRVAVTSDGPGTGAAFTVRLPLRRSAAPSQGNEDQGGQRTAGRLAGLRLLAVDDDADTRRMLEVLFTAEGAAVQVAGCDAEALACLTQPPADVLVLDIGLPGADGHALLRAIRQRPEWRAVPAVALTAYAADEDRREALAAGFQSHVAKPMQPERLIGIVQRLAGGARQQ